MFASHFRLSDEEIGKLWLDVRFTFDANFLLNLYRYSNDTRKQVLHILTRIQDRTFVTHQAATEFFNNRLGVIGEQEKSYESMQKTLNDVRQEFENVRRHPFLPADLLKKCTELFKEIDDNLKSSAKDFNKLISNDHILEEISAILDKKVEQPFKQERLQEIYKEGEIRYKSQIPPGYEDDKKPIPDKYGDLVIWNQILQNVEAGKKNIIFVTDDTKEDWWLIFNGQTIGPRPELVSEIQSRGVKFLMYTGDRFMHFASKYLREPVKKETIAELKELREQRHPVKPAKIFGGGALHSVNWPELSKQIDSIRSPFSESVVSELINRENFLRDIAGTDALRKAMEQAGYFKDIAGTDALRKAMEQAGVGYLRDIAGTDALRKAMEQAGTGYLGEKSISDIFKLRDEQSISSKRTSPTAADIPKAPENPTDKKAGKSKEDIEVQ